MGRRLTQIRGQVKKPLVLGQRETIGYPGNEIADPARPRALGIMVDAVSSFRLRKVMARTARAE